MQLPSVLHRIFPLQAFHSIAEAVDSRLRDGYEGGSDNWPLRAYCQRMNTPRMGFYVSYGGIRIGDSVRIVRGPHSGKTAKVTARATLGPGDMPHGFHLELENGDWATVQWDHLRRLPNPDNQGVCPYCEKPFENPVGWYGLVNGVPVLMVACPACRKVLGVMNER